MDFENHMIRINIGKGDKDRYVSFGKTFATSRNTDNAACPNNCWLLRTRCGAWYTPRRVQ